MNRDTFRKSNSRNFIFASHSRRVNFLLKKNAGFPENIFFNSIPHTGWDPLPGEANEKSHQLFSFVKMMVKQRKVSNHKIHVHIKAVYDKMHSLKEIISQTD